MKEITYRDMLIKDLSNLNKWKFAIDQETEELKTLAAEYAVIRATDYDKQPVGSGDNIQEEKLITMIAKKEQVRAELDLNWRKVKDMERLLSQLDKEDRILIERLVINYRKHEGEKLAEELHLEERQVYNRKNDALRKLALLRYGAAYQP